MYRWRIPLNRFFVLTQSLKAGSSQCVCACAGSLHRGGDQGGDQEPSDVRRSLSLGTRGRGHPSGGTLMGQAHQICYSFKNCRIFQNYLWSALLKWTQYLNIFQLLVKPRCGNKDAGNARDGNQSIRNARDENQSLRNAQDRLSGRRTKRFIIGSPGWKKRTLTYQ